MKFRRNTKQFMTLKKTLQRKIIKKGMKLVFQKFGLFLLLVVVFFKIQEISILECKWEIFKMKALSVFVEVKQQLATKGKKNGKSNLKRLSHYLQGDTSVVLTRSEHFGVLWGKGRYTMLAYVSVTVMTILKDCRLSL